MRPKLTLAISLLILAVLSLNAQTLTFINEDFDGVTVPAMPSRWSNPQSGMLNKTSWATVAEKGYATSQCAQVSLSTALGYSTSAKLLSPRVLLPSSKDYALTFKYKISGNATLYVYASTDGGSTNGTLLASLSTVSANYIDTTISLVSYKGRNITLVFNASLPTSNAANSVICIDNVIVNTAPTCKTPSDIYVTGTTASTATLNWNLAGSGSFPDYYSVHVRDGNDSLVYANDSIPSANQTCQVTGLSAGTTYTAWLRSDCDLTATDDFSDSVSITFFTPSLALSAPYVNDFESSTSLDGCLLHNCSLNTSSTYSRNGTNSIELTTTSYKNAYIIFPAINLQGNDVEIGYSIRRKVNTSYNSLPIYVSTIIGPMTYQVGYLTDPNDFSTFVQLREEVLDGGTTWYGRRANSVTLGSASDNPVMLCIAVEAGQSSSLYVDDVLIHSIPPCLRPEDLDVVSNSHNEVTIDWAGSNATSYNVRVSDNGSFDTTLTATQHPFTITGLNPSSTYDITVQGICSTTELSDTSEVLSATTLCSPLSPPLMEEGFDDVASNSAPQCWTMGWICRTTNTQVNSPFSPNANYSHQGAKSMGAVKLPDGAIAYLASQALDIDSVGKYDVSLWVNRQSSPLIPDEGIELWVTSKSNDTAGGIRLATIPRHYLSAPAVASTGWYEYSYNIPVSGIRYIMVVVRGKDGNLTYFDDVSIVLAPSCRKVLDITEGTVGERTLDISWTPGETEQQWVIDYDITQGTTMVCDTSVVTDTASFTFGGLEPSESYVVDGTIRAICQVGDTSVSVPFNFSFTTLCESIRSLPYRTSFETDDQAAYSNPLPKCWTRYTNSLSTAYGIYPCNKALTDYVKTGSQGMQIYSYASTVANSPSVLIAALPAIDTTALPINGLCLKFYARRLFSQSYFVDADLIVGVMSEPTDTSTFVPIDTFKIGSYSYEQFIVYFNGYSGNGNRIALRVNQGSVATQTMVDDLSLDTIPDCEPIESATVFKDITDTSAVILLSDTNSWSYGYVLSGGATTSMATADVNDTVATISGLSPQTSYDLYVRRNCGNGLYSVWSSPVTFTTAATPAAIPYICGFEDASENSKWEIADSKGSNSFRIGTAVDAVRSGVSALYVSNDNGINYAYDNTSSSLTYAYRVFDFAPSHYQIDFDWKATGGELDDDWGRVVLIPASASISGGYGLSMDIMSYPAGTIFLDPTGKDRLNLSKGWNHVSRQVDLSQDSGRYNLAVVWSNDGGSGTQLPLAIDNISVSLVSCITPSDVTFTSISSDSIAFSIQQQGSQWEVVLDTLPFNEDSIPSAPLRHSISSNNAFSFGNLEPNRVYYISARTICGSGDTSVWMPTKSVSTYCTAFDVPYTEGFESAGSDRCWSLITGSDSNSELGCTTLFHNSGYNSLKVKGAAVSPEFDVDSLHNYMVTGWALAPVANSSFTVGVIVDPNDASTYAEFNTVNLSQANKWVEFSAYFSDLSDDDNEDFRYAKRIVFSTGNNIIYFDNLNVDVTPTCPRPMALEVSAVTSNGFTIDFTEKAGATQWIVYVNGTPHTVSSKPAVITGLDAATDYQVGVASICSVGDTSAVALYGTVRTACDVAAIPYYEGFERLSRSYSVKSPDAIEDICWKQVNATTSQNNPNPRYMATIAVGDFTEGNQSLMLFGNSFKPLYLYLPHIPVLTRPLRISFDAKAESYWSSGTLSLGYFADANDTSFTALLSLAKVTSWETHTYVIDSLPSGARLGFRYGVTEDDGTKYFIDNLIINEVRTCSDPDAPAAFNVVADGAQIAFADTCVNHTSWQYVYGLKGFVPNGATPISIASKQFTLSGLQQETAYDLYVRAVCAPGDESNWVKCSFTTLCNPFAVSTANPFADSFEDLSAGEALSGCYRVDGNDDGYYKLKAFIDNSGSTDSYLYAHTGSMSLISQQYRTSVPDGHTAYRQFYLEAGHVYRVSIYTRASDYNDNMAYLLFGGSTDDMDTLASLRLGICRGTTSYGKVNIHDFSECWQEMENIINVSQSGNYYIAFGSDCGNSGNTYANIYFDDFTVEELTGCLPTSVAVDSVTTTTAYCHHNGTTPGAQYEYIVLFGSDTIAGPTLITSNLFSVSNLSPSAGYTLKLRNVCGDGNVSIWSTATFTTACGAYSMFPMHEDFEDDFIPQCWTQFSRGTAKNAWSANVTTIYCHDGNKSAFIDNRSAGTKTALVTKELNLTSPYGYYVRLWAYRSNDFNGISKVDEALHILYDTKRITAVNIGTAHEIGMVNRNVANSPVESQGEGFYMYEFQIPAGIVGSVWVAFDFHNQYAGGMYIDDITIEEIPSCTAPTKAAKVNSVTMATASLDIELGSHSEAQVAWALASAPDSYVGSLLTIGNSATATGLAANSNYIFRYRYVCAAGDTSDWSPAVTALTEESDCFKPQNLHTFGLVGGDHASIAWGKAPLAQSYQYILTAGGVTIDSAVANIDTVIYSNLTPNTSYSFYVRAFCSGDTTDWERITFRTTDESYPMPFVCDFESTTQNAEWVMANVNGGANYFTIGTGISNGGAKSLYVTNNGSSYNYDINSASSATASIMLEVEAGNYSIDYDWFCKAESGTDYGRVFLLPESIELGSFTFMSYSYSLPAGAICLDRGNSLAYENSWQHHSEIVNIPTTGAYRFYVLFTCSSSNGNQQPITIDNIVFRQVTCMPVDDIAMTSVRHDNAEAVVAKYSADAVVQYALLDTNDVASIDTWLADSSLSATATLSFSNLSPRTQYHLFVRQSCSATDSSRIKSISFTTPMPSVSAPYVCSFEPNEPYIGSWTVLNGNEAGTTPAASLIMDTAVHTAGSRSLYVSTDSSAYAYKNYGGGKVWDYAFVPVGFAPGAYSITYDWNCLGDADNDYGRIFLAPTSLTLEGGICPENLSANALPSGCIYLDGGLQLSNSDGWTTSNAEVSFDAFSDYYLVVMWHNDASNGSTTPLAIDDISIQYLTCPKIQADAVSYSVTDSSFTITAGGNNAGAALDYVVSTSHTCSDTVAHGSIVAGDSIFTVNGLLPSSHYFVFLSSLCAAGDTSFTTVVDLHTSCGVRTIYPYVETFEEFEKGSSLRTQLTDNCWLAPNTSDTYSYVIGNDYGGSKTLVVTNLNGTNVSQVVALPEFDTLAGKRLSFVYRTPVNGLGAYTNISTLEFGYLSNPGNSDSFVSLETLSDSRLAYTEVSYIFSDSVNAGARAAFRTSHKGTVHIDNVKVNDIAVSELYRDTVCYGGDYYMHGFSCPLGTLVPGDTILSRFQESSQLGVADSTVRVNLHVRNEIYTILYDTVCQGQHYVNGYWNISNPQSRTYTHTWHGDSTATGCDSIVSLSLCVVPTRYVVYDTICQGDSYILRGQRFTASGTYTVTGTGLHGCGDTTTLHLAVIDSLYVVYDTICNGDRYYFEGNYYSATGTYDVQKVGLYNCPLTKRLHLTVLPTDSTATVHICQGGQVVIADLVISQSGYYTTTVRAGGSSRCDMTYHITAVIDSMPIGYLSDYVCEGHTYTGNGISNLSVSSDTAVNVYTRTADALCDSMTVVTLSVSPTKYGEETVTMPAEGYYEWHDNTYTQPGDYQTVLYDALGCDSIVTLHLVVGSGIDDIADIHLDIIPNPIDAAANAYIYGNYTDISSVEVINGFGKVIASFTPQAYPIQLPKISTAGLYYIRLTTSLGKVYLQKLIVQ